MIRMKLLGGATRRAFEARGVAQSTSFVRDGGRPSRSSADGRRPCLRFAGDFARSLRMSLANASASRLPFFLSRFRENPFRSGAVLGRLSEPRFRIGPR
jgi:hypothetical protein